MKAKSINIFKKLNLKLHKSVWINEVHKYGNCNYFFAENVYLIYKFLTVWAILK